MFLNIGNRIIRQRDIIAILDLETTSVSKRTREFLRSCGERGGVVNAAEDIPKSYIICSEDGEEKVYISQLASATLLKRLEG